MGHPSTTGGMVNQRPDATPVGIFFCVGNDSLICPGMRRAAPHCQVPGRPHVPHARNGRNALIMTQPSHAITFTDEERAEVATLTDVLYRKALRLIQEANEFREMARLPLPHQGVADLTAYRARRPVSR